MKALIISALCLSAALSTRAAVNAIAYHGKLAVLDNSILDAKRPMTMEFRIYSTPAPTGKPCEWGRRAPVSLKADGSFYVELSDSLGTEISGAYCEKLADALATVSQPYLSVTVAGYSEMLPRKPLGKFHRAHMAAQAKVAGRVDANALVADSVMADQVNVEGDFSASGKATFADVRVNLTLKNLLSVGTGDSTITLASGAFPYSYRQHVLGVNQGQESLFDLLATMSSENLGTFSLVVPFGMSVPKFDCGGIAFTTFFDNGYYQPLPSR